MPEPLIDISGFIIEFAITEKIHFLQKAAISDKSAAMHMTCVLQQEIKLQMYNEIMEN